MAMKVFPLTAQDLARRLLGEVDRLGAEYNRTLPKKEGTFWTRELKAWLGRLGDESGLRTIATQPGVSEFLLDLVWWQNAPPQGAVLACEMEWGNTRDAKNNPGRVLEDFEKLMSFKAPFKLMLFDSYSNSDRQKEILALTEQALRDFADHRRGEEYLLFDVSPLPQAWHFTVRRDGADAQLRLEKLGLKPNAQPVTLSDTGTQDVEGVFLDFQTGIADRIKALRLERGLSLRDMVVKHGYHDSNYRRIEREGVGNLKSLLQLARAFDVPLHALIDGLGYQPPHS